MKIMFICGSLEPGRDGVGDYTRRLARELTNNSVNIAIAAINDGHILDTVQNKWSIGDSEIDILRLPASMDDDQSFNLLKKKVDQFDPQWLSVQYVPFSFHSKGLPFGFAKRLATLTKDRKIEIMVHEIAVGMPVGSRLKEMLWGKTQKLLLANLLKVLQPQVVHTHTTVYKRQLEKFGAVVTILPLFSNIHVNYPDLVHEKLIDKTPNNSKIDLLVFASVQLGAPIKQFAEEAAMLFKQTGIQLRMVFLGRSGKAQADWLNEWKAVGLEVLELGEQSEDEVSKILAQARYGVFSTPLVLAGKSGAVAAMREHGVTLICVSGKWEARGINVSENPFAITEYKHGNLARFFAIEGSFSYLPTLPIVTKQFMSDLKIN